MSASGLHTSIHAHIHMHAHKHRERDVHYKFSMTNSKSHHITPDSFFLGLRICLRICLSFQKKEFRSTFIPVFNTSMISAFLDSFSITFIICESHKDFFVKVCV